MTIETSFDRAGAIIDEAIASYKLDALSSVGNELMLAMLALVFSWRGIQLAMASGEGKSLSGVMNHVIKTIFGAGIVIYLMSATGFQTVFVGMVNESLTKVTGLLLPGGMSGNAIKTSISSMYVGMNAVSQLSADIFKDATLLDTLTIFFKNLPTLVILIFTQILIFVGIVIYFSIATVSLVMSKIALIIAPIFIPWLLLPATSFLFSGWLKFLISASLYQVVAAAIVYFSQSLFTNTAGLLKGVEQFPDALFAAIAMAALQLSIIALFIMVPQICRTLVMGQKIEVFESFSGK